MDNRNFIGAAMITIAVLVVGFFLYQQNERHFAESQRWLEVCKAQRHASLQNMADQDDIPISDELRAAALLGIDAWDADDLYSACYKEWHGSD